MTFQAHRRHIAIVALLLLFLSVQQARALGTQQVAVNERFEDGTTGWTIVGGPAIGEWKGTSWHSGDAGAKIGVLADGSVVTGTASITQTVPLPSDAGTITFSYWYRWSSTENLANYDTIVISVMDAADSTVVLCRSVADPGVNTPVNGWTNVSCNLSALKGNSVIVQFSVTNDSVEPTVLYVDDVSVLVEVPDATAPVTTATVLPSVPDGTNGYYTAVPTVTLQATDVGGSGVQTIFYQWDNGNTKTYAAPFAALSGTHTLTYYAKDFAKNVERKQTLQLLVDPTVPTTSASLNPAKPNGANGWYKTAPKVTFRATDPYSSADIRYSMDGGPYVLYTAPFTIPDGQHTLAYFAANSAGTAEAVHMLPFKVDTQKATPSAAPSIPAPDGKHGWYRRAPSVALSADDGAYGAGVDAVFFKLDYGSFGRYTTPITMREGVHNLFYHANDKAGNVGGDATLTMKIDLSDPVLTLTNLNPETVKVNRITLVGYASDAISGPPTVRVADKEVAVGKDSQFSATVPLRAGTNLITLAATDQAGRSTTITKTVIRRSRVLGVRIVAPRIASIRERRVHGAGRPVRQRVIITGEHFRKGAQVYVGKQSVPTIYGDANTLIAYLPLQHIGVGTYTVRVRNSDGQQATRKAGLIVLR